MTPDRDTRIRLERLKKQFFILELALGNRQKRGDAIVDVVLAYRPKAKSKPARRRKRRAAKIAKGK
jgi:hypothetical protein